MTRIQPLLKCLSLLLVVGGSLNGGQVLGSFTGIADKNLFFYTDLKVTTDIRQSLSYVIKNFGAIQIPILFPLDI